MRFMTVALVREGPSSQAWGRSPGSRLSPTSGALPGYSGGTAPDSHRLPFKAPKNRGHLQAVSRLLLMVGDPAVTGIVSGAGLAVNHWG